MAHKGWGVETLVITIVDDGPAMPSLVPESRGPDPVPLEGPPKRFGLRESPPQVTGSRRRRTQSRDKRDGMRVDPPGEVGPGDTTRVGHKVLLVAVDESGCTTVVVAGPLGDGLVPLFVPVPSSSGSS